MMLMTIIILSLTSCQPILKIFLGIKEPKIELKNSERLKYYQPFFNKNSKITSIYSLNDTLKLKEAFKDFNDFPIVYIENLDDEKVYYINCYDDTQDKIEDINSNKLPSSIKSNDSVFIKIEKYLDKLNSKKVQEIKNDELPYGKWNVYLVSGTFLGKKLRKRTLPIINLKEINSFKILDLSVNKSE